MDRRTLLAAGVGGVLLPRAAWGQEHGVGYLPGQTFQGYSGATLWSQEFGSRATASPQTKPKRPPHKKRRVRRAD